VVRPGSGVMTVRSTVPVMVIMIHFTMSVGSGAKVACHHTLIMQAAAKMIEVVTRLLASCTGSSLKLFHQFPRLHGFLKLPN